MGTPKREKSAKLGRTACNNLAIKTARMGTGVASKKSISPERYRACNKTPKLVSSVTTNKVVKVNTGMEARMPSRSTLAYCANSGDRTTLNNQLLPERMK